MAKEPTLAELRKGSSNVSEPSLSSMRKEAEKKTAARDAEFKKTEDLAKKNIKPLKPGEALVDPNLSFSKGQGLSSSGKTTGSFDVPEPVYSAGSAGLRDTPLKASEVRDRVLRETSESNVRNTVGYQAADSAGKLASSVNKSYEKGIKPLGKDLVDYLRKPEKTTTSQDINAGMQLAQRTGEVAASGAFDFAKTFTQGLVDTSKIAAEKYGLAGQIVNDASTYINDTLQTLGTDTHEMYKQLNREKLDPAGSTIAGLALTNDLLQVALVDKAELAMAAASHVPVVGTAITKFNEALSFGIDHLAAGMEPVLKLDSRFENDEQVKKASRAIASIIGTFVAAKGMHETSNLAGKFKSTFMETIKTAREAQAAGRLAKSVDPIDVATRQGVAAITGNDSAIKSFEALNTPENAGGRKKIKALTETQRFAFESEVADNFGEAFQGMSEQAKAAGIDVNLAGKNGIQIKDNPFDEFPAYYNPETNTIEFNPSKMLDQIKTLWDGKEILYGSGKQQKIFKMLEGESYAELTKRYIDELYAHESAHMKTIEPADLEAVRRAEAAGDELAKAKAIHDIEVKANRYMVRNPSPLIEADVQASLDAIGSNLQEMRANNSFKKSLKFEDPDLEKGYERWKMRTKNNPETRALDYGSLRDRLLKDKRAGFKSGEQIGQYFGTTSGETPDAVLDSYRKRYEAEQGYKAKGKEIAKQREALLSKDADLKATVEKVLSEDQKRYTRQVEERLFRSEKKVTETKVEALMDRMVEISKRKASEKKLRDKFDNKVEAQKAITDYMRELHVPKSSPLRAKFLERLRNAKSAEDASRIIKEIDTEFSKQKRSALKKQIVETVKTVKAETVNGVRKGKMTPEQQRKIDSIAEGIRTVSYKDAYAKRIELISEFRAKNGDIELPDDIVDQLAILETYGIDGQTTSQLERTQNTINSIIETGKSDRRIQLERERATRQSKIDAISKEMPEAPVSSEAIKRYEAEQDGAKVTAKEFFNSSTPFALLMNKLGRFSKAREFGNAASRLGGEMIAAADSAQRRWAKSVNDLADVRDKIYGSEHEVSKFLNERHELGEFTNAKGDKVNLSLTRNEAAFIEMQMQNARGKELLTSGKGNAFTPEMLDAAKKILTKEDHAVLEKVVEQYRDIYPEFNQAFGKDNGVDLGYVENYFGQLHLDSEAVDAPELSAAELLLQAASPKHIGQTPGSAKARGSHVAPVKISSNIFSDLAEYQRKAYHYIEGHTAIKEANALMRDKKFRANVEKTFGKSMIRSLQFHVDNFTRGGLPNEFRKGKAEKAISKMNSMVSQALLAKPTVVMGQFSSAATFRAEARNIRFYREGLSKWRSDPKARAKELIQYIPSLETRYMDSPVEVLDKAAKPKGKFGSFLDAVRNLQKKPLEWADFKTTMRGASGLFEDRVKAFMEAGQSEEAAKVAAGREVSTMIAGTQSTSSYLGKSEFELKHPIITGLKNQPNKAAQLTLDIVSDMASKRISMKEGVRRLFWNNVVQPVSYHMLRSAGRHIVAGATAATMGLDEEDSDKLKGEDIFSKSGMAKSIFSNATGKLFLGDMIDLVINRMSGNNYDYRPGVINTLTDDFLQTITEAVGENKGKALYPAARAVSRQMGIGDPAYLIDALKLMNKE